MTWDFSRSADYQFDPDQIVVNAGQASLRPLSLELKDAASFGAGSHHGTLSSAGLLQLNAGADASLASTWTPKWGQLVGYWKMDGNWQDASALAGHGTPTGSPSFVTARIGSQAAEFDGSSESFEVAANPEYDGLEHSYCVWLSTDNSGGGTRVFEKGGYQIGGGYSLELGLNYPRVTEWIDTNSACQVSSSVRMQENVWNHVCGSFDGTTAKVYLNGVETGSQGCAGITTNTAPITFAKAAANTSDYYSGQMDDFALWKTALSAADIAILYQRQKAKHAGHYDSPVFDVGSELSEWKGFRATTPLPFGKELVGLSGNETSSAYASLRNTAGATGSGNELSQGLLGLWHLNESSGTTLADSSGNGHALTATAAGSLNQPGMLDRGVHLNAGSGEVMTTPALNLGNNFSFSAWIKLENPWGAWHTLFGNGDTGNSDGFKLAVDTWNSSDGRLIFESANGVLGEKAQTPVAMVPRGKWHHVVAVVDRAAGTADLYVNGQLANAGSNVARTDFNNTGVMYLGSLTGGGGTMLGWMDEVGLWTRALSATEVSELYRRGANRISYQIRSCTDPSCQCASLSVTPAGSATDCDGDGVTNLLDASDAHAAMWTGPSGTGESFFSEIQNNASVNSVGKPTGAVGTGGLHLDWSASFFTPAASPAANPYFQFRAYLESDDESTQCAGSPCLPELSSAALSPHAPYWGGGASISSQNSVSFSKIQSLSGSLTGSCAKLQISTDGGTSYRWWDASANSGAGDWATALDTMTQANDLADLTTARLQALSAGSFRFRAYLTTSAGDQSTSCDLSELSLNYLP